jgi:UDP-glucose:(heptosyl)LPS alpha-1,3-glucosyltransferase
MRLTLVYEKLVPAGGLEKYLMEFARRLEASGHDLNFVTSAVDPGVRSTLHGRILRLGRPPVLGSLRMWLFDRRAYGVASATKADAVLGFGRTVRQDIHRAGGGCHRIYSALLPWWKRWRLKNLLELHLEKRLYTGGQTKFFVANCHAVADDLARVYGISADRFRVIHTPVDSTSFAPAKDRLAHRAEWCRLANSDPQRPILLFVSMGHRRKGLDVLLQGLSKLEDAMLWIVGQPLSARYRRLIRSLGLTDRICAFSPQQNVVPFYQAADWFVHPTLYDPCANTVLQSMSCGLPGVISARDGAVEHVHDGVNGLVLHNPEDSAGLATVLRWALGRRPEERDAMGLAARETMLPFTWERHLREWKDLLGLV